MHQRLYKYDRGNTFIELVVHENSFSSGDGIWFTRTKLESLMSEGEFQNLLSTVALLGLNNPAKTVDVDGKQKKEAEAEQKRTAAAQLKQAKLKSARYIHKAPRIYKCNTPSCRRAFSSQPFLLKHLASATCGLSKTPLRK